MKSAAPLLFLLLAVFPASPAPAATIPFDLVDNRVMIEVSLNHRGSFRLLLDTGAGGLVVREEVAATLDLPHLKEYQESGVGEKTVTSHQSSIDSIEFAGLSLGPQGCSIIPFDDTPAVWGNERFDGIIGLEVFRRWVVRIDYAGRNVTFSEPKTFRRPRGATAVAFRRPEQVPIVPATIDGVPGQFAVDTGTRSSLIVTGPFVEKHKLREKYRVTFETITGWGIGGPVHSQLARVTSMRLGTVPLHGIVARLSTQKEGFLTSTGMDGLIGGDLLRRFRVTFDYSRSVMLLEPNDRVARPDTWDGTGMWFGQKGEAFEVMEVVEGGPAAAAGLRRGDLIVSIDGRPTAGMSLPAERLALYYDGRPRTVTLGLLGRTVRVTLKALV